MIATLGLEMDGIFINFGLEMTENLLNFGLEMKIK